jgi:hypothetical protein
MEGIRKAMNKINLNEGQWEDRKQWSLSFGQRRKKFCNRNIYICLEKLIKLCVTNLSSNLFLSSRAVVTGIFLQEAQNLHLNTDSPAGSVARRHAMGRDHIITWRREVKVVPVSMGGGFLQVYRRGQCAVLFYRNTNLTFIILKSM